MLFNSPVFLIGFLPICLVGFDLPLKFHPVAIRASAVDTPFGAD
jgi:hypothetical protein